MCPEPSVRPSIHGNHGRHWSSSGKWHCIMFCVLHLQVSTVDRFQGQQNDYIILSLVRTRFVGHLRDVRRLVVAMSRARLGLFILARGSLFSTCHELQPAFSIVSGGSHFVMWEGLAGQTW